MLIDSLTVANAFVTFLSTYLDDNTTVEFLTMFAASFYEEQLINLPKRHIAKWKQLFPSSPGPQSFIASF